MKRYLLDDNLYRHDTPQPSYWEATARVPAARAPRLETTETCDVAIIGGGFTGLSAAMHLARDHQLDVRVLEAGHIGWGASGRNGGFCCIGGAATTASGLVQLVGAEAATEFMQASSRAVGWVRELIGDLEIDCQPTGSAEVFVAHSRSAAKMQQEELALMRDQLGLDVAWLSADECREQWLDTSECHGALVTRPSFGLHPLDYCRGLAQAATRHGVQLHSHSEVLEWGPKEGGLTRLVTAAGAVRARKVIVACNGFLREDLHPALAGRTLPVTSAIVVTRPLREAELQQQRWQTDDVIANSRQLLNYYRLLPDGRLLFGGRGHSDGDPAGEAANYDLLIAALRRNFPAWSEVEIDYRWHGLICFTATLRPTVGCFEGDPDSFFSFGYHGNGVNLASYFGKQLADWVATGEVPSEIPVICRGLSRRFPLPRLRKTYLRLGIALAQWRDRRD